VSLDCFVRTLNADEAPKQEQSPTTHASSLIRTKPVTPVKDELLHGLEVDFLNLLRTESNPRPFLQAEQLLAETNDNSHWTNYSQAVKILLAERSKTGIPLLLRYMVIHAERSARHVMIPAYR
jgi:hypothetical protein